MIFYTNGYDLWIWNDAAGQPWRKLYGFYSKDSLQHLVFQRTEKQPVSKITPNPIVAGRMYQIEAVRRVVEKFAENGYDLSINRYKEIVHEEVEYDPPRVVIGRLKKLEKEIAADLEELEAMLG